MVELTIQRVHKSKCLKKYSFCDSTLLWVRDKECTSEKVFVGLYSLLALKYTEGTWILHIASRILDSRGSTVDWSLGQLSSDFNSI